MSVIDWQSWAADVKAQLADLSRRIATIENNLAPEVRQTLNEIRTRVAIDDQKASETLSRLELIRLQIEHLALSMLDETKLARMKAALNSSAQSLQDSIDKQGPQ